MRSRVINNFLGSFLQVYGALILLPIVVSFYYSEPYVYAIGFIFASFASITMGTGLKFASEGDSPQVSEAMFATVLGWILAVGFGAIPLLAEVSFINALFESAAGLTTTGISLIQKPSNLPNSLLFWRSFMQWIGGLGILTFFIAVIRETGGASRRLFSAEAHKTDAGSIRPSLTKSVAALWKVYGFMTVLIAGTFIAFRVSVFESMLHGFSTISTGGFSTRAGSIAAFNSTGLEAITVLFMFIGGVNFVLLHRFLRSEFHSIWKSSEFRLYFKIFLGVSLLLSSQLLLQGNALSAALLDGFFQSAAMISSTGYSTISVTVFSSFIQLLLIGVMFFGGSLGSTSGGLKMFRLKTLIEQLRVRIKAYSMPQTAINEVKIDGEIMERSTVRTISVLFFTWVTVVFVATMLTMLFEDISMLTALSGAVSSASNMGPVYMSMDRMVAMSAATKVLWSIVMLAGRLEMLPLLAIFNSDLLKDSS